MNEQERLERKISELQFAVAELALYLDTHPNCTKAISLLNSYRMMYKESIDEYRQKYGKLIITQNDSDDDNRWLWIDSPWPWENQDNKERV